MRRIRSHPGDQSGATSRRLPSADRAAPGLVQILPVPELTGHLAVALIERLAVVGVLAEPHFARPCPSRTFRNQSGSASAWRAKPTMSPAPCRER